MEPEARKPPEGPGRWPSVRLRLTTARWPRDGRLSAGALARLDAMTREGWRIRQASPRHFAVRSAEPDLLDRLRVLLPPGPAAGLTGAELDALIRARTGLPADPDDLNAAHRRTGAAIAPGWTGPGAALDAVTPERARRATPPEKG